MVETSDFDILLENTEKFLAECNGIYTMTDLKYSPKFQGATMVFKISLFASIRANLMLPDRVREDKDLFDERLQARDANQLGL